MQSELDAIGARQKKLALAIVDFLSDWVEEPDDDELPIVNRNVPISDSIEEILSYGCSFVDPSDKLVKSAIRHLLYYINPWNGIEQIKPNLIEDIGFTEDEYAYYSKNLYD